MKESYGKLGKATPEECCSMLEKVYRAQLYVVEQLEAMLAKEDLDAMHFTVLNLQLDDVEKKLDEALVEMGSLALRGILKTDYEDSLDHLKFFNFLNEDGISYQGDYAEQRFEIPTLEEVFARLTPLQIEQYREM